MKHLPAIAVYSCAAAMFAIIMYVRLAHPDMSETRLFIAFWREWLLVGVLGLAAAGIMILEINRDTR